MAPMLFAAVLELDITAAGSAMAGGYVSSKSPVSLSQFKESASSSRVSMSDPSLYHVGGFLASTHDGMSVISVTPVGE